MSVFRTTQRQARSQVARPALVVEVIQRTDGIEVGVAYGTSQRLDRLLAREFAIRKLDNAVAYVLAGLAYDTKFNMKEVLLLITATIRERSDA